MEDTPIAEDNLSTGKRKRSPGNLVDVPIPYPSQLGSGLYARGPNLLSLPGGHPLPKRPRLPPKPLNTVDHVGPGLNDLPSAILQHTFSYVDPSSLGRLVRVNQRFRSLLDPRCSLIVTKHEQNVYLVRPQDSVWNISRRRNLPTMPKPMDQLSEAAMFALAFGPCCQFCGRRARGAKSSFKPWASGPGADGVRTIWPFKIRSCVSCLRPRLRKYAQVLLDDDHLRPGLCSAVFTQDMDFVSQSFLRSASVPFGVELQKYYYVPDIVLLQEGFAEARSLGAAEEWLKGLSVRGRQLEDDAARFEQWEASQSLLKAQETLHGRVLTCDSLDTPCTRSTFASPPPAMPLNIGLPPMPMYGVPPGMEAPHAMPTVRSDAASIGSQRSTGTHKASKSSRERARIRSSKKQDIIDRCRRLDPPISRDILDRLDAFDAALQIPMELNDNSWQTLKERLLQQRRKVLLEDEAKNSARTAPVPGRFQPPPRSDDYVVAHADISRREKLCKIAEEYIKQKYGYGGWITYPNAPQFAADVLIHTRQRFVEEEERVQQIQAQSGFMPFQEPLKLDDMKWLFEQTIKTRTEQIRKDLFLCPVCPTSNPVKHFAFESIIQHYASKHTSAFSIGAQKVSWKADWPETTPFMSHPERVHTPTPSVTHTPTLSHLPLSTMSPGSIMTSTIGRRSPDTMSLMSNVTNTYSVASSSAVARPRLSTAPGFGMYEVQRDFLSGELLRGWNMMSDFLQMPSTLRLYLTIGQACAAVSGKYRNQPALDLFIDCINSKMELRDIREIEHLRCAECTITGDPNARATWALQDLVIHFKKAHIDHNESESKPDWKTDMIALPEPAVIRSMQVDSRFSASLAPFLQDAVTTSTLKFVQSNGPARRQTTRHDTESSARYFAEERRSTIDKYHAHQPIHDSIKHAFQQEYSRPVQSSIAATYGDHSTLRDSWSASSRTIMGHGISGDARHYVPMTAAERFQTRPRPISTNPPLFPPNATRDQGLDEYTSATDTMTCSDTVRSYHSRNAQPPVSEVEDFLSTIDAQVDVEMAEGGVGRSPSGHGTRQASRSNSAFGVARRDSRRTSPELIEYHSMRPSRVVLDPAYESRQPIRMHVQDRQLPVSSRSDGVSIEVMQRHQSNIIEFAHDGTPLPNSGGVFQETPPQQIHGAGPRPYMRGQEYPRLGGEYHVAPQRYANQRAYTDHPPVEYIHPPSFPSDRIYDSRTGQYYVAERPQYIPLDERRSRMQTSYDEYGRPVQYRELPMDSGREDDTRYQSYAAKHDERRYTER